MTAHTSSSQSESRVVFPTTDWSLIRQVTGASARRLGVACTFLRAVLEADLRLLSVSRQAA